MDDRGMQNVFSCRMGVQLMTNGLLDLRRHTPRANEFGADFGIIAADAGLLHLCERCAEISGFDQRSLRALWNRLVEDEVADIPEQAVDEKPLAVPDPA